MKIDARGQTAKRLNAAIAASHDKVVEVEGVVGQRYLGTALVDKILKIDGIPGNALGAYLDGAKIELFGNAQEATGDTMNAGEIVIHGNAGDATGYAMRGGKIFVEGDVGYRCGIHMKAYRDAHPAIVIGGRAGSFLGEYQAGGTIVVLGGEDESRTVGYFCGTGMHGGEIWLRAAVDRAVVQKVRKRAEYLHGHRIFEIDARQRKSLQAALYRQLTRRRALHERQKVL